MAEDYGGGMSWLYSTYPQDDVFNYDAFVGDINSMGLFPGTTNYDYGGGGFDQMGFEEINQMFGLVDLDPFYDDFTYEDREYLNSLGLNGNAMVEAAFGGGFSSAMGGQGVTGFDINEFLDTAYTIPNSILTESSGSLARNKIMSDIDIAAEARLEAAAEELHFLEQQYSSKMAEYQLKKFRGFMTSDVDYNRETGELEDTGTYGLAVKALNENLENAAYNLQTAVINYMDDPGYDGRFHTIDEDGNVVGSQELVDDYRYNRQAKSDEEIEQLVETDLFTIPGLTGEGQFLDSGEKNTALGKVIAVALDAVGFTDVGTKLYLTQSMWNATVNALEKGFNKIFGTSIDIPLTVNLHEMGAALLNEKFVDKNGDPILQDFAEKAENFLPFANPEFAVNLALLGGNNLGSYEPTGENLFQNIMDGLLEGQVLDRVQDLSEQGKFEGVETTRSTGLMGFAENVGAYIQKGGVALQKVFGPVLSQVIVDQVFFEGLPAGAVLNAIGVTLGPQNAEDWVRYLEDKGIDPNNVQERDISYYRGLVEDYLTEEEPTASGVVPYAELMGHIGDGGIVTKYMNALDEHLYKNYKKGLDEFQPADLATVLYREWQDNRDYVADATKDLTYLDIYGKYVVYESMVDFSNLLLEEGEPKKVVKSFEQFEQDYYDDIREAAGSYGIGNGFVVDSDLVLNLMDTAGIKGLLETPEVLDNNFDYIVTAGQQGEQLSENYYDDSIETANPMSFTATGLVDEDVIVLPDLEVMGYKFEYLSNPEGPDGVYDPISGVTYEFSQDRFVNNPGFEDDRYNFPSLTAEDILTSDKTLSPQRLAEIAKQGRIEYNELLKLVKNEPLSYLGFTYPEHKKEIVAGYINQPDFTPNGKKAVFRINTDVISAEDFYNKYGVNTSELEVNTGKDNIGMYMLNIPNATYMTSSDLQKLGIDPYMNDDMVIAGHMKYIGRGDVPGVGSRQRYEFKNDDLYQDRLDEYFDPTIRAERKLENNLTNYFVQKYSGDEEGNGEILRDIEFRQFWSSLLTYHGVDLTQPGYEDFVPKSLIEYFTEYGLTDENGDVLPSNTVYLPDFTVESEYRQVENYDLFTKNVSLGGSSGGFMAGTRPVLFIEDLTTGLVEVYDPDRYNNVDGAYEFQSADNLTLDELMVRIPGADNFTTADRQHSVKALKYLYATGQITMDEVIEADKDLFSREYFSQFTFLPNGQPTEYVYDPEMIYQDGATGSAFDVNPDTGEFYFMEDYSYENPGLVGSTDTNNEALAFINLPDFVVTSYDNFDDLNNAYQERIDFIQDTNLDYFQKDFLIENAYNLFESRKAFLELDETSQQLINEAVANATDGYVQLPNFVVTATNINKLDEELQERLNLINATTDLSEEQKQYEIDLANAIYDSKKTELDLITSKNTAVATLENQRDSWIAQYGTASQQAADLQDRIDKIESYVLPDFNVTAYMNADNPSQYMQDFVNEVMKGTTEEFGNFLSVENADQILFNVAALAQSQEDLDIAEKARDDNYQLYVAEQQKYNTAITERNNAIEERDANKTEIDRLKGELYVELDNFVVTATDIEGATTERDEFINQINQMVADGDITSEQGDLEIELANNTFDVYKATQDIASLQTSTDETIAGLRADLKNAQDSAASFEAEADEFEGKYNATKADLEANQTYKLPDFNVFGAMQTMGYVWSDEKGYFENPQGLEQVAARDAWVADYEQQLIDDGILTQEQITNVVDDVRNAIFARQSRAFWKSESKKHEGELAEAESRIGELETFTLPEFNITATNINQLNNYLDDYLGYVNQAETDGNISAEQAINFRGIISNLRDNGASIFNLEAENATKQGRIDELDGKNTELIGTIKLRDLEINGYISKISLLGAGFDVTSYDNIDDLDTGLSAFIETINNSDLDEEMKQSQIAFAQNMADMRKEALFVPTYVAPDFSVIATGDLSGLNTSYGEAMYTLNSYLENEYITQDEYDGFVSDLDSAYNTRRDEIIPAYVLPEFTVSALDDQGQFSNLESERDGFIADLQEFLDNDYISLAEYNAYTQQIDEAFEAKKREITPIYDLPDFSVYGQLQPGEDFTDIDTAYNNALDTLNTNARLGYISTSEYIDKYEELNTSYQDARQGIAPTYELPDFTVYGQIAEGDDTTAIDEFYQGELSRLEQYRDSGYISVPEYYDFLGQLESDYISQREGILPTYTLPDFTVTPATSLAELAEIEKAALDRFNLFNTSGYFGEDFDVLGEQQNLLDLIADERARLQGTYQLPDFVVTDTQGLLTQDDISNLFTEYEEGLRGDVLEGMLGLDDFFDAMEGARSTFDFEFEKRKPIQPREGGYKVIPDPGDGFIGDDDDPIDVQPGDNDFRNFVDNQGYIDFDGLDTGGILTGNYMAKLDPAYQLAELLLGQDAAKQMYPTGKSRGLADEEFQDIVNNFMLGQAESAFDMQSGLAGKMQDLATEQRRLQRQSDLDLMAEFGDPYRKQLEELYPEQAAALKQQREIADISAERAKGDLSPREQAQVEQQAYLFGAGRGREFDPMTLYRQLGEEVGIREGRETQATNQLTALMNMERGLYGDLPSVIGAQSPFIEGVGDIQTPFNIGGIMDLGSVDYANQMKLQEVNQAIAGLQRDYDTAVALNQPSKAKETLVKLNEFKATADAIQSGLSTAKAAFGTVKDIYGDIKSFFGGSKSSGGYTNPSSFSNNLNFNQVQDTNDYLRGLGIF